MQNDNMDLKQAMFSAGDSVIGAAVLVFLGVVSGNWLDARLHSSPWGVVSLSLIGAGLGLWRMIRKATAMGKAEGSLDSPNSTSDDPSSSHEPPIPPIKADEKDYPKRNLKDASAKSAFDFLNQGDSE